MSKGDPVPPLPPDAPKAGETYRHYKGDSYRVVGLALHSNDDVWMVVYEPLYENPEVTLFVRPLAEWGEEVDPPQLDVSGEAGWQARRVPRFIRAQSM